MFQRDIGHQGVNRQFLVPDLQLEPFEWGNRGHNDRVIVDHHCCIGDDRLRSLAECQQIKSGAPLSTTEPLFSYVRSCWAGVGHQKFESKCKTKKSIAEQLNHFGHHF